MRYLLVAPQLGLNADGTVTPGGLLLFGRCVARALASMPTLDRLDVWTQVDAAGSVSTIERMLAPYAHGRLRIGVRAFGGSRRALAAALTRASVLRRVDRVMYLLVNQAVLGLGPGHPPYVVWEIGREVSERLSTWRRRALQGADQLLSISHHTARAACQRNDGVPCATVVHPSVEPPLFGVEGEEAYEPYDPGTRMPAALIVANMNDDAPYKGHLPLIAAWRQVTEEVADAELWIVGDGVRRPMLERYASSLPPSTARRIRFFGRLADDDLSELYRRCRLFVMPSSGEGFGLVFVEAARHGIPCIGGKYDSVKEIVGHDESGLLVEQHPHDIALACMSLLSDASLARRLGWEGHRRYLERFRFHHFRARLLDAVSGGRAPGA